MAVEDGHVLELGARGELETKRVEELDVVPLQDAE